MGKKVNPKNRKRPSANDSFGDLEAKLCPDCGRDLGDSVEECPYCPSSSMGTQPPVYQPRQPLREPHETSFGSVLKAVLFLGLMLYGVYIYAPKTNNQDDSSPSTPSYIAEPAKPDIELIESHWGKSEFGTQAVEGTVRNNSDDAKRYVEINVNFFDSHGNQIDTGLANTTNLPPRTSWKFNAICMKAVEGMTYHVTSVGSR